MAALALVPAGEDELELTSAYLRSCRRYTRAHTARARDLVTELAELKYEYAARLGEAKCLVRRVQKIEREQAAADQGEYRS